MENKKNNSLLLVFIIFLTSFLLGVIFSLRLNDYLETSLLKNYYNITDNKKEELDLSKFWLVYDIIQNNYYDSKELKKEDLIEGTVKGLLEGLKDKHSSYFDKQENVAFNESLSGDFEGIGAVIAENPLGVEIERVIKGSPAKKYDLRSGDVIVSANGTSLEGMNSTEAVSYIKGEAGSKVVLEIIRDGNLIKKDVFREKIKIPSVEYEDYENNTGYISVNVFGEETSKEFEEALYQLRDKKGIIIDLRDNGGGYLISAVEMLSHLIKRGDVLVVTKYKDGKRDDIYKSINNGNLYDGKIVILINENTASASEIVSGALKEYKKAIVVGNKSYGKGSVQKPFELSDGSMVKLTIAKWFTPNGVNIDEEGILPDLEVNFKEEDFIKLYDRQKEQAKVILNKFIETNDIQKTIDTFGTGTTSTGSIK